MVTPQPTEMQIEGKIDIEEAVKEMLAIEVEADKRDPFEGMSNMQVAEIYYKMKPEDRHLFRQFKSFTSFTTRHMDMTLPVIIWLEASYEKCSQGCQLGMQRPLQM